MNLLIPLAFLLGWSAVDDLAEAIDPFSCGVTTTADGVRQERMVRWAPRDPMCLYVSVDNAFDYASRVLWVRNGGAPYGANVDCRGNLTDDRVPCLVDVTDKSFRVVDQVWISCSSLRRCGPFGSDEGLCCHQ